MSRLSKTVRQMFVICGLLFLGGDIVSQSIGCSKSEHCRSQKSGDIGLSEL